MKDIISKISSYDLFNNLLPGAIFSLLLNELTGLNLTHSNIIYTLIIYYFVGLCISRIGALLLDKPLRRYFTPKSKEHNYDDYIGSCKEDKKIELLSEINNMYRTLISTFILLTAAVPFQLFIEVLNLSKPAYTIIIVILLLILFVASYRRQTIFIANRIIHHKNKKS